MHARFLAVAAAAVAICGKEVTHLPGAEVPLPSKTYSGFADGGVPPSGRGRLKFHYVAFECNHDPAMAPVVFWYNGGPGAASKFGIFTELGPWMLDVDSEKTVTFNATGIPSPIPNDFTWTKYFNLIAIDSPPPIGMSYCTEEGPSGGLTSCGAWTDEEVFKANHQAVTNILKKDFPQWIANDLYIIGESYAGVYVPGLVNEFLDKPNGINLKGFAVGDGCMGIGVACLNLTAPQFTYPSTWAGPWYDLQFFGGHGQISNALFRKILNECPEEGLRSGVMTQQCWRYIDEMKQQVAGFFDYGLYDECPSNEFGSHLERRQRKALLKKLNLIKADRVGAAPGHDATGYACPGTAFDDYWKRQEVLDAFHIPKGMQFLNTDNGVGFPYQETAKDVRPFYRRAAKAGLRILTYEGDADACGLSSYGLQDIYDELWAKEGYAKTEDWRAWTTDAERKNVGGYVMEWGADIAHLTVRGSGHMVPQNRPASADAMIKAFIRHEDWQQYQW